MDNHECYREFLVAADDLEERGAPAHVVAYLRRAEAVYALEKGARIKPDHLEWEAFGAQLDAWARVGISETYPPDFPLEHRFHQLEVLLALVECLAAYRALTIQG